MSSSLLGALMGSIGAFFVGDKLGRKKELFLAAGLYGNGALVFHKRELTQYQQKVFLSGLAG